MGMLGKEKSHGAINHSLHFGSSPSPPLNFFFVAQHTTQYAKPFVDVRSFEESF